MSQRKLLCQYVAASDPNFARNICMKFGYTVPPVRNPRELGGLLDQLVEMEGEPAFIEILDHHPDKELILESYGTSKLEQSTHLGADGSQTKGGCGCGGCKGCQGSKQLNYANADAAGTVAAQINSTNNATQHNAHQITSTQTGVIILACAMIISLAIMSKK